MVRVVTGLGFPSASECGGVSEPHRPHRSPQRVVGVFLSPAPQMRTWGFRKACGLLVSDRAGMI